MNNSSKQKAKTWPHVRHQQFEIRLRQSNANWFEIKGVAVNKKMPYILENWIDWPENIILPDVTAYIKAEQNQNISNGHPFPLHKYIHHGLSSQAMLFNLIGPLVVVNDLSPLRNAFKSAKISWPAGDVKAKFEMENRSIFNEDSGQPTSIDLVLKGDENSRPLFIEAKLVEREFGGCSVMQGGDCDGRNPADDFNQCYLHHIGRHYWKLLEQHGFLKELAGSSSICPLALYYQFFRELLFAIESGGDFVLLYDERNPTFYADGPTGKRGLMPFLLSFVPEQLRQYVHKISIQQIIASYKETEWLSDFKSKYGL